jgi:acyl-phosphate glycerol 3-phosphate acyltransferase
MNFAAVIVLAYFVGSIPFGYLVARSRGIDIRAAGSGNIGATNVARTLGAKTGAMVLAFDFAKGAVPVLIAQFVAESNWLPILAGLTAILGHMFPVWLRFSGGKGVATGTGVVAVLLPIPTLLGLLTWLATLSATRYVSLASILGGAALVAARIIIVPEPFVPQQRILTAFCFLAFGLVLVRHSGNLVRLWRGQEPRISESLAMRVLAKVIHVLALGLWFGGGFFFTFVAAVLIFQTWRTYGEMSFNERPVGLPVSGSFNADAANRIAGATVGPIFPFYFLMQGVCGFLALLTALAFTRAQPNRRVHRLRFLVILVAVLTVVVGWPLSQKVSDLRAQRYDHDEAVATQAKEQFGRMHLYSLFLNFGTVGLAGIAMALAAMLPSEKGESAQA